MVCVAVFGVIIKYSVDDMRGGMADVGGPHVCQSVSQLGLREGARATIRRWGHFSVAHQSAPRQHLTTQLHRQHQRNKLTDNLRSFISYRMTGLVGPVMTNKQ